MTERLMVGHDQITIHVTGELLAVDVQMPAGGGPPMLHRHESMEVYRVVGGELVIYRADDDGSIERILARAGDVIGVSGGREHTVRNESGAPAEAFVVFTPGDPAERFVRAVAALAAGTPPTIADVLATAERHGVQITRPIPS